MIRVIPLPGLLVVGICLSGCGKSGDEPAVVAQEAQIRVETARCEMCAANIVKAVESVEGVERVNVDLESKVVTVAYIPTRTDIAGLEKAITNAGYNANDAKRDQQAYEALPSCCQ